MMNITELTNQLLRRFKDVPNVDEDDVSDWIMRAMLEHGFASSDSVPTQYVPLILLYAEADGATQVALKTAYFFSFVDKDESIDKSSISEQYRRLSEILWRRYRRQKDDGVGNIGGSSVRIMRRVDRP